MVANVVTDKRRAAAKKHASRRYVCQCGKVCHGNGGWSSHKRACKARDPRFIYGGTDGGVSY